MATRKSVDDIQISWRRYGGTAANFRQYRIDWPGGSRAEVATPEEARLIAYALTKAFGWPIVDFTEEDQHVDA